MSAFRVYSWHRHRADISVPNGRNVPEKSIHLQVNANQAEIIALNSKITFCFTNNLQNILGKEELGLQTVLTVLRAQPTQQLS